MMELDWDGLLPPSCLPEKRLRERAVKMGMAMTARPGAAMTEAFDTEQETRAAYEFFENRRMSLPILLDPATRALGRGLRGSPPEDATVLCVQDTTELNLSHLATCTGLGPIGNPKNRGLFAHVALAVGTDGVPIGLLGTETWVRPVEQRGKAKTRRAKPFEEKESVRWWRTIEQAEDRVLRPGLLVHVGDRESNIYEVFSRSCAKSFRVLVRAAHDRGEMVMGGAYEEPDRGAVLVFRGDSPIVAERFAQADPYVRNGLVSNWTVKKWLTVVGDGAQIPQL